eukprot:TRINITY_DN2892_c0_g1_i2.p1 TRINITY_DN2892_c0_g1~~TRINITY_DN2892_c0_g1_i2.p1  ORF type:complete len:116 (+),score=4.52 TRINITY_DN2892_c0_g1_i2:125-472(+)
MIDCDGNRLQIERCSARAHPHCSTSSYSTAEMSLFVLTSPMSCSASFKADHLSTITEILPFVMITLAFWTRTMFPTLQGRIFSPRTLSVTFPDASPITTVLRSSPAASWSLITFP